MAAVPFDTLKLARKLEAAGYSPSQAADTSAALADVLGDQMATKSDLRELERDLKIWTAGMTGLIIAAMSAMKFVGH